MPNVWPRITLVMTTWAPKGEEGEKRIAAVKRSLESLSKYLKYEGELALHVGDDGSKCGDYGTSVDSPPATWWPGPRSFSRQERHGVGASLNAGMRAAFEKSDLALYIVDDWSLHCELDLTEWASLLNHEDVGMVRFGPAHPNLFGRVEHFGSVTDPVDHDGFCLRLVPQVVVVGGNRRANSYSFAHRPALYHRRFLERWGGFDEDVDALACEWLYNEKWSCAGGTDIVLALTYEWIHISSNRLTLVNPSAEREN